jgi:alcohol dehydrogenase (cytochrome c)
MPQDTRKRSALSRSALASISVIALIASAAAADYKMTVSRERLLNAQNEPQNWLMMNGDYSSTRYSKLTQINRDNVKNLRMVWALGLGGMQDIGQNGPENEVNPLIDNGYMYTTDGWGTVYKIDARDPNKGEFVWISNSGVRHEGNVPRTRGIALWEDKVIANLPDGRVIALNRDSGEIVWDKKVAVANEFGSREKFFTAPMVIDGKVLVANGAGDGATRGWLAALDVNTGNELWRWYAVPKPGEPGSETWKDKNNAWQTGGGAVWVTGTYDAASNQTIWGTGNPVPMMDPRVRPGDNLYTNSAISWDPDSGKMNWYFQFTPGDMWDFDEVGTHILIDGNVDGQPRNLITHSARNGFVYTMERSNGQIVVAKPYMDNVNWTKGIDQKTGKPLDYDPGKDIQSYSGLANPTAENPIKKVCPNRTGGNNYWPSSYSPRTRLLYIPVLTACEIVTNDKDMPKKEPGWYARTGGAYKAEERYESNLTAVDPVTGEVRKNLHLPYPNYSGTLSTGGGLVFVALLDGTVAAYDDTTLEELWKINVGSGFSAPPMTFAVNGKQYLAIAAGPSSAARSKLVNTPELKEQRNATVLYVFSL